MVRFGNSRSVRAAVANLALLSRDRRTYDRLQKGKYRAMFFFDNIEAFEVRENAGDTGFASIVDL